MSKVKTIKIDLKKYKPAYLRSKFTNPSTGENVTPQTISKWIKDGEIPAKYAQQAVEL